MQQFTLINIVILAIISSVKFYKLSWLDNTNHSNGLWEGGGWSSNNITTETLGPPLVWLNTKPGYGWGRTCEVNVCIILSTCTMSYYSFIAHLSSRCQRTGKKNNKNESYMQRKAINHLMQVQGVNSYQCCFFSCYRIAGKFREVQFLQFSRMIT